MIIESTERSIQMEHNRIHIDTLNFKDMADDELQKILLEMNSEQLNIVRDMAYHYLFSYTLEMLNLLKNGNFLEEFNISDEEKEKIINSYTQVIQMFKNYHSHLSEGDRKEGVDFLFNLRKELYDTYITLYGYEVENSYIKEMYEYEIIKESWNKSYEHIPVDYRDIEGVINRIQYVLNSNRIDHYTFINLISNILKIIPLRLSKYRYLDIVKTTLMRNFNGYPVNIVENQMEKYKMIFNSRFAANFGVLFDNYFTEIQKYNDIDLKNKPREELEIDLGEITQVHFEINNLRTFIQNLGIIINRLIVLYLSLEKIPSKEEFKSYFNKWEQFEKDGDEEILESLLKESDERLAKREKELLDKVMPFEKVIQEALKRGIIQNEPIDQDVKYTRKLLTYYNDINFTKHDALFLDSYEIIGKDYLEQLVDSLIQYIDRNLRNMNSLERKIRMRRLLASIELPFNDIGEFLSFIQYSLDNKIVSNGELVYCLGEINQVLDTYEHYINEH